MQCSGFTKVLIWFLTFFLLLSSLVRMQEQGIINHIYKNAMYNASYCEGIDLTSDELRPLTLYDFGGVFFLFAAGEHIKNCVRILKSEQVYPIYNFRCSVVPFHLSRSLFYFFAD